MNNNQIFYHFLNAVAPEEKKKFKKTSFGYETYTPISESKIKVSFREKNKSITVKKLETEYVGGSYENFERIKTYRVEEFDDRLRFIPK